MGHTSDLDSFLNLHKPQLVSSGIPEIYWSTINEKIQNQIFDAGTAFQILKIDYERTREPHEPVWSLQSIIDLETNNPNHVYLIDHTWTFRVENAIKQLSEVDALRQRLCGICGVDPHLKNELVDTLFEKIWKFCRCYSIGNAENVEDRLPVWYVMDEVGSAVMHSTSPNMRIVPFVHINTQITFSLLFPIKHIDGEQFIYVDFAEGITDPDQKLAYLLPWVPQTFSNVTFKPPTPGPDYYLSGHKTETLPILSNFKSRTLKQIYKVFTDYKLIAQYLSDARFKIVDNAEEADVLWLTSHFKAFEELSKTPDRYINQFPFEFVLTVKDLLCLTCRKFSENLPDWFPITYNLKTEVANFVSYFQHREQQNEDNIWIIKPYNLARSLDTHITNNLDYILRLLLTGPKIVQKYVTKPVLFHRPECEGSVKFDVRYVVLLKSVKPLKVYVYKKFFLRFANKPFELNDFHIYEKHFTVMNYAEHVVLKHMLCEEFVEKWEEQFPGCSWESVEERIFGMLRDIFVSATKDEPPCGIAHNPQSRALYAADIILEQGHKIQPKILEINWTPDCQRACEYYPRFYNDIFKLFYLDEVPDVFTEL